MRDDIPAILGGLPRPSKYVQINNRVVSAFLLEPLDDGIFFDTTSPTPWMDYLNCLLRAACIRQNQLPGGLLVHPATNMDLIKEFVTQTPFALSLGADHGIRSRGVKIHGIQIDEHLSAPEGAAVLTPLGDFYPNGEVPLKQLEANGHQRLMQLASQKLYELERNYKPELNLMMLIPEEYRFINDAKNLPNPRVRLSAVKNLEHRIKNFLKNPNQPPVAK